MTSTPVSELSGPVDALFSDLDGTMTSDGMIEAETVVALHRLCATGLPVILVTGRPAGWGQAMASLFPFKAVVTENGGVTFVREGRCFRKLYGVPEGSLSDWRQRMRAAARDVMDEVDGAALSSDSAYREVDLAIDWNEEVSLPQEDADRAVEMLRKEGFFASRSSVHVNFGPPKFDKLTAIKRVAAQVFERGADELDGFVYVGDALNDAPVFGGFAKSVGVANVKRFWDELSHKPKYLTEAAEGAGFRELVEHLIGLLESQ